MLREPIEEFAGERPLLLAHTPDRHSRERILDDRLFIRGKFSILVRTFNLGSGGWPALVHREFIGVA